MRTIGLLHTNAKIIEDLRRDDPEGVVSIRVTGDLPTSIRQLRFGIVLSVDELAELLGVQ